jgi:hypothetical protein
MARRRSAPNHPRDSDRDSGSRNSALEIRVVTGLVRLAAVEPVAVRDEAPIALLADEEAERCLRVTTTAVHRCEVRKDAEFEAPSECTGDPPASPRTLQLERRARRAVLAPALVDSDAAAHLLRSPKGDRDSLSGTSHRERARLRVVQHVRTQRDDDGISGLRRDRDTKRTPDCSLVWRLALEDDDRRPLRYVGGVAVAGDHERECNERWDDEQRRTSHWPVRSYAWCQEVRSTHCMSLRNVWNFRPGARLRRSGDGGCRALQSRSHFVTTPNGMKGPSGW